ncbi:hypothetical protein ACOME3_004807 [Neoechinorhynchus agilis]
MSPDESETCPAYGLVTLNVGGHEYILDIARVRLRDGPTFRYINQYFRTRQLPNDEIAVDVLREAQYFGMDNMIRRMMDEMPLLIATSRYNSFQHYLFDPQLAKNFQSFLGRLVHKAAFPDFGRCLFGPIICFNCHVIQVNADHVCRFEGRLTDFEVSSAKCRETSLESHNSEAQTLEFVDSASMYHEFQRQTDYIVARLQAVGYCVSKTLISCSFTGMCANCMQSRLYTAEGFLAPRKCMNEACFLEFNWGQILKKQSGQCRQLCDDWDSLKIMKG